MMWKQLQQFQPQKRRPDFVEQPVQKPNPVYNIDSALQFLNMAASAIPDPNDSAISMSSSNGSNAEEKLRALQMKLKVQPVIPVNAPPKPKYTIESFEGSPQKVVQQNKLKALQMKFGTNQKLPEPQAQQQIPTQIPPHQPTITLDHYSPVFSKEKQNVVVAESVEEADEVAQVLQLLRSPVSPRRNVAKKSPMLALDSPESRIPQVSMQKTPEKQVKTEAKKEKQFTVKSLSEVQDQVNARMAQQRIAREQQKQQQLQQHERTEVEDLAQEFLAQYARKSQPMMLRSSSAKSPVKSRSPTRTAEEMRDIKIGALQREVQKTEAVMKKKVLKLSYMNELQPSQQRKIALLIGDENTQIEQEATETGDVHVTLSFLTDKQGEFENKEIQQIEFLIRNKDVPAGQEMTQRHSTLIDQYLSRRSGQIKRPSSASTTVKGERTVLWAARTIDSIIKSRAQYLRNEVNAMLRGKLAKSDEVLLQVSRSLVSNDFAPLSLQDYVNTVYLKQNLGQSQRAGSLQQDLEWAVRKFGAYQPSCRFAALFLSDVVVNYDQYCGIIGVRPETHSFAPFQCYRQSRHITRDEFALIRASEAQVLGVCLLVFEEISKQYQQKRITVKIDGRDVHQTVQTVKFPQHAPSIGNLVAKVFSDFKQALSVVTDDVPAYVSAQFVMGEVSCFPVWVEVGGDHEAELYQFLEAVIRVVCAVQQQAGIWAGTK